MLEKPAIHPFLDLDTTQRSRWIAALCDEASSPPLGVTLAFPLLPRGETPLSWLEDQYRRAEASGRATPLRDSVTSLLVRELEGIELGNKLQVLGVLVDLAGTCSFTEVAPKLRDWVRGDYFAEATYQIDGHAICLRQTLWSTIIGWGGSEGMIPYLKRDLGRPKLKCGALCFSALGRLSPSDAITEIPGTYAWPLPYWNEILHDFFGNFTGAARILVDPHLQSAWRSCLGALLWDPETSERFRPRWGKFRKLLTSAGIDLSELFGEDRIYLKPREQPLMSLQIDLTSFGQETDQNLLSYYQGLLEGAYTAPVEAQEFR